MSNGPDHCVGEPGVSKVYGGHDSSGSPSASVDEAGEALLDDGSGKSKRWAERVRGSSAMSRASSRSGGSSCIEDGDDPPADRIERGSNVVSPGRSRSSSWDSSVMAPSSELGSLGSAWRFRRAVSIFA